MYMLRYVVCYYRSTACGLLMVDIITNVWSRKKLTANKLSPLNQQQSIPLFITGYVKVTKYINDIWNTKHQINLKNLVSRYICFRLLFSFKARNFS